MDYAKEYRKVDARATAEESQADDYRRRAELDRWELCRIASAAIAEGSSFKAFGKAVGKGGETIRRQTKVWERYGATSPAGRPTYGDAMELISGDSPGDGWKRKDLSAAKKVLADPALAAELIKDPTVNRIVTNAVLAEGGKTRAHPVVPDGRREFDAFDYLAKLALACGNVMRNLPDYVPNRDLREQARLDAEKCELTARFLRDYADGRDITDEFTEYLKGQT